MSDTPPLSPSLLERLIDEDARRTTEIRLSRREMSDRLTRSIVRDVADLLNTRPRCEDWSEQYEELDGSLLDYGLPDFSGRDFASAADREFLRRAVQQTIERFEPRLNDVRVELVAADNELDNRVRFDVRAKIGAQPDFVVFQLDRDTTAGEFRLPDEEA